MARSKKGISLAFVIVVVLALMILSGMLFSAASHSLSMTGDSTDGRQAYLTAKSAIEYAKTVAFGKAKTTGLAPFSVGPDGGGYKEIADAAPDGTTAYAECANPGGDGKTWKILAKVKYKNADKYRQLAYSFTLTKNAAPVNLPASDFLACGVNYGSEKILAMDGYWFCLYGIDQRKSASYPVVETLPLVSKKDAGRGYLKAPEIILLGDNGSGNFDAPAGKYCLTSEDTSAELHSGFIAIENDIYGHSYDNGNDKAHLYLYSDEDTAASGIIYFAGENSGKCTVQLGGGNGAADTKAVVIPAGYYRFSNGLDIFSLSPVGDSFQDTAGHNLTKLTETGAPEIQKYSQDVAFAENQKTGDNFSVVSGADWTSSKGADFASDGVFAGGSTLRSQRADNGHWYSLNGGLCLDTFAVFTYANSVGWPSRYVDPPYSDPYGADVTDWDATFYNIFTAKQFFLRFVSTNNDFTLPGAYHVVFHSDLVSLSMAQTDTSAGGSADDRPKIVQAANAPDSQFLLTSLSKDETTGDYKNVTLAVQNAIKVVYGGGTETYTIPSGVYSVESGFNFFAAPPSQGWDAFWKGCSQGDYPASGGGSGEAGGSGGFTITPGQYTDS